MLTTLELLRKYDVAGPRYTSYPTVPAWTETVGATDYAQCLARIAPDQALSLYFHVPFCEKLCHFCGCFKTITPDHSRSRPYVDSLIKELNMIARQMPSPKRRVTQIHFGGGTPNFLKPEELSAVMAAVRQSFLIDPEAEIAIEMHPRTSTKEFCRNLANEAFNRISLGVQDFDADVQRLINRFQTFEMTRDMVSELRDLGFASFNFDLIYGLPGQTPERFARTLELTLTLNPDRLAVYSYAHVPWVSPVQRSFKDADLPTPEVKLELFRMAHAFFTQNGYRQIGMDHFARADDDLSRAFDSGSVHRNFMGYTTKADAHQIGCGASSISFVGGHYFQNSKKLDAYATAVDAGQFPIIRGCLLNPDDAIRRDLITDIMCRMRVAKKSFAAKHGIDFAAYFGDDLRRLAPLIADGLVNDTDSELTVVGDGKLLLRNVAMCFDVYLEGVKNNAINPVFSRTV